MHNIQLIKVFLASPGDVMQERELARKTLDSINRTTGDERGIRFEVIGWDTDSHAAYGNDGQALINEQIADMSEYALFVGIMWNRFGSPTPRAGSGTEEEFESAVKSFEQVGRPEIKFYFNQNPFSPQTVAESEQKTKVLLFRDRIRENGLTADYDGSENFGQKFRDDIESWLVMHSPNKLVPPKIEAQPSDIPRTDAKRTIQKTDDSGMWFLLGGGFYLADEINEPSDGKITLKAPISNAEDDATFRSFQPDDYGRQEPLAFAHQNTGALARVLDAKRTSMQNTSYWALTLQLERPDSGFHSEMSINGISADQIAEMRAQSILLNIEPDSRSQSKLDVALTRIFVGGMNSLIKVDGSVLPDLWRNVKKDKEAFLPLARLWSVFQLVTSETCEHILELSMGPIVDEKVHIKFRGKRRKRYFNVEPPVITVEGDCDLSSIR